MLQKSRQARGWVCTADVTPDQIVGVSYLPKNAMIDLMTSIDMQKQYALERLMESHFPHLFYKNYLLNTPQYYKALVKKSTSRSTSKERERTVMLDQHYQRRLDNEIGLDRLPESIGGSNPTRLGEYTNFFDKAFENSFVHCKLGFV